MTDFKTESVTSFLKWLINNFKYKKTMNKEESKIVSVVGTCATIGATTVAGIATVVGQIIGMFVGLYYVIKLGTLKEIKNVLEEVRENAIMD